MEHNRTCDLFLTQSGLWEGSFSNYVNRGGGIVQEGRIAVEVSVGEDGVIRHKNIFMDKDGKQSDYEGTARMKVEGDRLINLDVMTEDPNTGNQIRNHKFDGYITDHHVYVLETYEEILPDGKVDHRRSDVHYYFIGETELVMLADVYVNDSLLVFASTILEGTPGGLVRAG